MKENFIEENDREERASHLKVHIRSDSEVEIMSREEDEILNKIYSKGTIKSALATLIEQHSETENLTDEEDVQICKTIIVALKHDSADESTIIKLVQFLANRFVDRREGFNDRACIVSSVLFKKDAFDIFGRKSIENFEILLPKFLLEKKGSEHKNINEVSNQNFQASYRDFKENENHYDQELNPMFLQQALKILREDTSKEALRAVHSNFESILDRTSNRVFNQCSQQAFDQLTDLTHYDLLEDQFRSLAFLMKRDIKFFETALKMFCDSKSEVMKTLLIFSLNVLEGIVDFDVKLKIHLSFAETLSSTEVELEPSTREAALSFIQRGIDLLKSSQNTN